MTGLFGLPAELIGYLSSYLDDEALLAIRQTNRLLESSSFDYFGKRFFRKKGYLITTPSINALKSISAHEQLRKYVQHVWFNPDCYTFVERTCCSRELDFDSSDDDAETKKPVDSLSEDVCRKCKAYRECMMDYAQLLSKRKLADELTQAFTNLPNLAVIGMRRSEDHSPWGWSRLKDDVGEDPRVLGPIPTGPQRALSGATKLFIAVIDSVAAARVDLKRLYTDVIEIDNILPRRLPQERLNLACRSLLYLEVNVSKALLVNRQRANYLLAPDHRAWGDGLLRLLYATPQLRELGLQVFPERSPPARYEFGLGDYPFQTIITLANNVQLSHLTRLKLEKIPAYHRDLIAFMAPSQSHLTSLKLRDVRLILLDPNERPWQFVFEFLRDSCPRLSYLLLYHLMIEFLAVTFVENPTTPTPSSQPYGEPAGGEFFTNYDDIALEASGREQVETEVTEIVDKHWYQKPLFSYAMDESLWHTDTSDEEW